MVSNSAFAAICVTSGLYEHFQYRSSALTQSIYEYVTKLMAQRAKEYQEAEDEGRPPGQFWTDISAPKVLSDIIEAIVGAVYVADGFSSKGAETVYEKLLKPFYDKHITLKTLSQHPTKLLFELFQRQGCRQFKTSTDRKEQAGNTHTVHILVHGVVLASAEDSDANIAARHASFFALDALEGDSAFVARVCDCRSNTQGSGREPQADSEIEEGMIIE
ncbi:hypothetical protein DXG03_009156 [Asterophora parasitica]|uniref:RNase III domain-containing protein n=1 Tax=Asterophora parasitica TaxID=117018 RepID=A0A9P7KA10_9AGAR|nr:hypothetical protein DXG03_009156 [Asterophora parasitica]